MKHFRLLLVALYVMAVVAGVLVLALVLLIRPQPRSGSPRLGRVGQRRLDAVREGVT